MAVSIQETINMVIVELLKVSQKLLGYLVTLDLMRVLHLHFHH